MKRNTLKLITLLIIPALISSTAFKPIEKIALGNKIPHDKVEMKDISGKTYTLGKLKKKNGLLVVFAANKCIAIKFWGDRLMDIAQYAEDNEIGIAWINANQTQRSEGESLANMQTFASEKGITFPYMIDKDFLLVNAFGAEVTPTSYLFDANSQLVYQGLVDDNMMDASAVQENYLKDALASLVSKSEIETKEIFGRGCRIPRE